MSDILIRSACGGSSTTALCSKWEGSHWAILRILAANKRRLNPSSPSNKTPFSLCDAISKPKPVI